MDTYSITWRNTCPVDTILLEFTANITDQTQSFRLLTTYLVMGGDRYIFVRLLSSKMISQEQLDLCIFRRAFEGD